MTIFILESKGRSIVYEDDNFVVCPPETVNIPITHSSFHMFSKRDKAFIVAYPESLDDAIELTKKLDPRTFSERVKATLKEMGGVI